MKCSSAWAWGHTRREKSKNSARARVSFSLWPLKIARPPRSFRVRATELCGFSVHATRRLRQQRRRRRLQRIPARAHTHTKYHNTRGSLARPCKAWAPPSPTTVTPTEHGDASRNFLLLLFLKRRRRGGGGGVKNVRTISASSQPPGLAFKVHHRACYSNSIHHHHHHHHSRRHLNASEHRKGSRNGYNQPSVFYTAVVCEVYIRLPRAY